MLTGEYLERKAEEKLIELTPHGGRAQLTREGLAILHAIACLHDEISRARGEAVKKIESRLFSLENRSNAA